MVVPASRQLKFLCKGKKALGAAHSLLKSTGDVRVPTPPPLPFTTPTSLAPAYPFIPGFRASLPQRFTPPAPDSLANPLFPTNGSRPSHLFAQNYSMVRPGFASNLLLPFICS